ncbi:MAG: hypothetical protein NT099_05320 [Candidatus Saganbacteria bacterium]|nr:hypothetical protein [Candidatus Saganbacteria bacterium]
MDGFSRSSFRGKRHRQTSTATTFVASNHSKNKQTPDDFQNFSDRLERVEILCGETHLQEIFPPIEIPLQDILRLNDRNRNDYFEAALPLAAVAKTLQRQASITLTIKGEAALVLHIPAIPAGSSLIPLIEHLQAATQEIEAQTRQLVTPSTIYASIKASCEQLRIQSVGDPSPNHNIDVSSVTLERLKIAAFLTQYISRDCKSLSRQDLPALLAELKTSGFVREITIQKTTSPAGIVETHGMLVTPGLIKMAILHPKDLQPIIERLANPREQGLAALIVRAIILKWEAIQERNDPSERKLDALLQEAGSAWFLKTMLEHFITGQESAAREKEYSRPMMPVSLTSSPSQH